MFYSILDININYFFPAPNFIISVPRISVTQFASLGVSLDARGTNRSKGWKSPATLRDIWRSLQRIHYSVTSILGTPKRGFAPSLRSVAPKGISKWRAHVLNIFVVPLHFFGSTSTISRFGERFCDGQFLVCCSSTQVPPRPAICKSGGHVPPPCPMESAPLPAVNSNADPITNTNLLFLCNIESQEIFNLFDNTVK